jgi:hypothetical protein
MQPPSVTLDTLDPNDIEEDDDEAWLHANRKSSRRRLDSQSSTGTMRSLPALEEVFVSVAVGTTDPQSTINGEFNNRLSNGIGDADEPDLKSGQVTLAAEDETTPICDNKDIWDLAGPLSPDSVAGATNHDETVHVPVDLPEMDDSARSATISEASHKIGCRSSLDEGVEPAFLHDEDYPAGWMVYHRILGVVPKLDADLYDGKVDPALVHQ